MLKKLEAEIEALVTVQTGGTILAGLSSGEGFNQLYNIILISPNFKKSNGRCFIPERNSPAVYGS